MQKAQVFDQGVGDTKANTQQVKDILAIVDAGAKLIASGKDVARVQALVADGVAHVNEGYAKQAALLHDHNIVAIKAYQDAVNSQIADRKAEIDLQVQSIGMGAKEAQQLMETARIRSQVDKTIEQLNRARAKDGSNKELIDAQIKTQKDSIPILVQQEKDKWTATAAAQADGINGMKTALANFMDE